MIKNEKLQAGNECLQARDFDKARSLFEEVLKDDPENVCAVRGKMFCDLKISEIKELKDKSITEGKRVPYSRYAKSVPGNYSGYFIRIKEYFDLAELNKHLAELIVENERKTDNEAGMIAESSVNEGLRGLFGGHYYKRRNGKYVKSLPDIIGLIVFSIAVPLTLICCIVETGMTWPAKILILFLIIFLFGLFALPGLQDLVMIRKGKYALKNTVSQKDIEAETDKLRKQLEKNADTLDSSYFKIRDMDRKIMSRMS